MNDDELSDIASGVETHDVVAKAIGAQLEMLRQVPRHPFFEAFTADDVARSIADLENDQRRLRVHSVVDPRSTDLDVPALCAACGEPRPCAVVLELRRVYG